MTTISTPLFFPRHEVIRNPSFHWVGRGGFGVTHPGNKRVRIVVSDQIVKYLELGRSQRGQVSHDLLNNQLRDTKFVIDRDSALADLEADDKKAASGAKGARRIGKSRRESLMQKHQSVEQIRSYPSGTCIEVGYRWALDIVCHLLREEADSGRKALNELGALNEEEPASIFSNEKNQSPTKRNREAETPSQCFHRVFDHALPALKKYGSSEGPSVDSMFALLFPDEAGIEPDEEVICKRQKVEPFLDLLNEEDEGDTLDFMNDLLKSSDSLNFGFLLGA